MVRKQVKALTVLYLVPCQHFGVYFAPYQILLVMGAVFVLLAIPFLLFYDRTVLPLCNRCLPRQEYASMPLRRPGLRPRRLRAEIRRVDAQPRPMSMSLLEKCSLLNDMPLAFCVIELVFNKDGRGVDFIFRYCNAEMANIEGVPVEEMLAVIAKLEEMGCVISRQENSLTLHGPERLSAFAQLQTQPHPGFPTDMQAQMMAIASLAKGTSVVVENVFENRFAHAGDLNRMGANILINGRTAVIRGVERLSGARVTARDLRGGAALAIAGLAAQGETIVERARLIDRGYESLETALTHLGADVQRISVERGEEHP